MRALAQLIKTALPMPRLLIAFALAVTSLGTTALADQPRGSELGILLQQIGERVEQYFARAQSLICIETVTWQPLALSMMNDGLGRRIESELRLSWNPTAETGPATEAQTLRQVVKVNGRPPRDNDYNNCTTPEQQTSETQPLSMLLASQRPDYTFRIAGRTTVEGRRAVMIDYRENAKPTVTVDMVENNENCISFDIKGGSKGRIWVDEVTFDVLRMDQGIVGTVEIPMPRKAQRTGLPLYWTMERMDITTKFKPVTFQNPEETLVLPVSVTSFRVTRGSGTPRLRTTTEYRDYRRFLTGARVVPQ